MPPQFSASTGGAENRDTRHIEGSESIYQVCGGLGWHAPDLLDSGIEAAKTNGADLLVIDTPPQADGTALAAANADIVLVPIRPAIWDLQAAQPSLLLTGIASRPAFIVLNGVRPNSNVGNEASTGLIGQGAEVAPVMLKRRGRTVQEAYPNEAAAEEVTQLYHWLCGHVGMPTCGQASEAA